MRKWPFLVFLVLYGFTAFGQTISGNLNFCSGNNTILTATGAPSGATFTWFKDGTTIINNNATLTVTSPGTYSATAKGSTTIDYPPVTVTMNPKPVFTFTFNNDNTCSGTNIDFNSNVTSGTAPFVYAWDFGDGNTSTTQNPSHAFTSLGCSTATLTVKLTVTDANGCSAIMTKSVTIKQAPDVQIKDAQNPYNEFSNCTNSPSSSKPNFTIKLQNISPSSSCITSYTVDWGDGNTQNGLSNGSFPLTYTYSKLGQFVLTITAIGTNGCSYSKSYPVVNQSNPAVGITGPGSTSGCAPSGFWFSLKNYEPNSPGTLYVWDFGDGSAKVTWTTPVLVDSIFHVFTSSSCGLSGNQFTVKVTAKNGCDSTSATVNNIKIYNKPKANFTFLGGCVNTNITFNNTTVPGHNLGNCNNTLTTYQWNFGDPSSSQNTSTSTSPTHSYTSAGTYIVTLIATGSCGNDTIQKPICILKSPVATFDASSLVVCGPATITFNNTSSTLNDCGSPSYNWSYTFTPSNCSSSLPYCGFANGTNASSLNPAMTFTGPGTYNIKLTVTNACSSSSITKAITIKRSPVVTLPTIPNACAAVTITPTTATAFNCADQPMTYAWTFAGGNISTSTSLSPAAVTFSNIGINSISLTATNECGASAPATTSFNIGASPDITPVSSVAVCAGTSVGPFNFSSSTSGVTFRWTNNNTSIGLASSGSTNTIPAFTTINNTAGTITSTITVTATSGGCSTSTTFTISVYPKSNPPLVTSPVNYCQGATASTLTATATTGSTLNWYSTATGGTPTTITPAPNTSTLGSTTYYVSQTNAFGCESPRATIVVGVTAVPAITATYSNPTSCGSTTGTIIISGLTANATYTIRYSKNGTPFIITSTALSTGTLTLSNLSAGNYSSFTATYNNCVSNVLGPYDLTDPNPPATPVVDGSSTLCEGGTITLSASSSTGAIYQWSGPNAFNSTMANPFINNATVAATGSYCAVVKLNGCSSSPACTNVTVNPSPGQVTLQNSGPACLGGTITLTAYRSGSVTTGYSWTGPNGFTSLLNPIVLSNVSNAQAGTYIVTATSLSYNCSSAPASTIVAINTPATISATSSDPKSCTSADGTISISGLAINTTYVISYSKNGGALTTVSPNPKSNSSGVIVIGGLSSGLYSNITATLNGCISNAAGPLTLTDPNPPAAPVVVSNGPICSGGTLSFTASSVAGASYVWTGPNGFTATGQSVIVPNATVAASGTYVTRIILNGCTSNPAPVDALVNATPNVVTVSSNSPVCEGSTLSFTTSSQVANAVYNWIGPANFSSNDKQPIVPNVASTAAGTYTLTLSNGTCSSAPASTVVSINAVPVITGSFTNPSSCATSNGSIILNGLKPNVLYDVQYSRNGSLLTTASLTSGSSGAITISNLPAGLYNNVSVTLSGCPSNQLGPYDLVQSNAPAAPVTSSSGPVCSGNTLTLFASSTSNSIVSYKWSGPNGFTSTQQNPVIVNVPASATGNYSVIAVINGCPSAASNVDVEVRQSPTVIAGPDLNLCKGQSLQFNASGAQTYQWYPMNGLSCNNCPNPIANPSTSTRYLVEGNDNIGCIGYDTVNVNVVQPFTLSAADKDTICAGQSIQLLATGAPLYKWTPATGLNNPSIPNPVASPGATTIYTVEGYDPNGCFSQTKVITLTVGQIPTVNLGLDKVVPAGTQINLSGQVTNGPIVKWQWTPRTDLSCTDCPSPIAIIKKDIIYHLAITNNYGCTGSDDIDIKVYCDRSQVFIPNAFSPDGDGINDILLVRGSGIQTVKYFRIFNRWGELLFEKSNFPPNDPQYGWDGRIRGKTGPPDVFVYTAEVICDMGSTFFYKGNVSLLK